MGRQLAEYQETLSLPRTAFAARVDLPALEARLAQRWEEMDLTSLVARKNVGRPPFVLHEGPSFASGHDDLAAAAAKLIKDLVVRSRAMSGVRIELALGWDCHDLPIERRAEEYLTLSGTTPEPAALRIACRRQAQHHVEAQRAELRRLGALFDWGDAYMTMSRDHEAQVLRALGRLAQGAIYRQRGPILWCCTCQRALSAGEPEQRERVVPSIYAALDVNVGADAAALLGGRPLAALIWTTAAWTLPGARAIAFAPRMRYRAYRQGDSYLLVAAERREAVARATGLELDEERAITLDSDALRQLRCAHPLLDASELPVLPAEFIRADRGSGLAHVAPGHTSHDHTLGRRHGLVVSSLIDAAGHFTAEAGELAGRHALDEETVVVAALAERGSLRSPPGDVVTRQVGHCWRCQQALVTRAIRRWYLSLDHGNLRARALEAMAQLRWIPAAGRERASRFLSTSPDWPLSHPRRWGVPFPALQCRGCGESILEPALTEHIATQIAQQGSEAWLALPANTLAPPGFSCPRCGGQVFERTSTVIDACFEAAVSRAAPAPALDVGPVDLAMVGREQRPGLLAAALLAAVGAERPLPFKTALTHGAVLDRAGRRLAGATPPQLAPARLVAEKGAELLRFWVATADSRGDLRFTPSSLDNLAGLHRRLRNTLRFALGNLHDYDPLRDAIAASELCDLDRYLLTRFGLLVGEVRAAYARYAFHRAVKRITSFCVRDLSAFYFETAKDWLYCDVPDSRRRRSCQTALATMTEGLLSLLAPVLPFSAEEAWALRPGAGRAPRSVHLTDLPDPAPLCALDVDGLVERFDRLRLYRAEVLRVLEPFRASGHHSREARVVIGGAFEVRDFLGEFTEIAALLSASQVALADIQTETGLVRSVRLPRFGVRVEVASGRACARCRRWEHSLAPDTGRDLCRRCEAVVESLAERRA